MENLLRQNVETENAINATSGIKMGQFLYVEFVGIPSGMRKTGNPFIGDCLKFTKMVCRCADYGSVLERRTGVKSEVLQRNGMHHITDLVLQSNTNPDQYYLSLQKVEGAFCETEYRHIDGRVYTDVEKAYLQSFIPPKKDSPKQIGLGLSGSEQVKPFSVKLENVLVVKQGGQVLYELIAVHSVAQ